MITIKRILFILFILVLIVSFFQIDSFSYELTPEIREELNHISNNASTIHNYRVLLKVIAIALAIIAIFNISKIKESSTVSFFILVSIVCFLINLYIGVSGFGKASLDSLFDKYSSDSFSYIYSGEMIVFKFEENGNPILLVCQKGKLENTKANKTIHDILSITFKDYSISSTLYNKLINSTTSSEYITFEKNPLKTIFEEQLIDYSYDFIRISIHPNVINAAGL